MTVHRSQGSQFEVVTWSCRRRLAARDARDAVHGGDARDGQVRLVGAAEAVVAACGKPAARATGLAARLR
jgi:hypothetical protein